MKDEVFKAAKSISESEAILVGISNGLSIAEGYNIFAENEMFHKQFGDFLRQYSIHSVLEGCFFPHPETRHAFLERLVNFWIKEYQPSEVMKDLFSILDQRNYFIITSNADTHLELSGFSPERIFEMEGTFVQLLEGKGIDDKSRQVADFIRTNGNKRFVLLELGVGSRNRMIKKPLMELAAQLPLATYITMNLAGELYIPEGITRKSIGLQGDMTVTICELRKALSM